MRSESLKGPSALESGDSENTFGIFSASGMVSLVTVHLGVVCLFFLRFFASVLGGAADIVAEGPVVAVLWGGPLPLGVLTS